MNKLVRDNIPNIIEQQGDNPDFVILDSFDYYNELKKKLTEEVTEFNISDDVLELCDLIEVISAILDYKNINNKEFEEMRLKKNKINGKFKNKIFLNGIHRMS
jgi:predicted house-cleaning noncanonical NTP pyrophosphatase (MazG superfamily)